MRKKPWMVAIAVLTVIGMAGIGYATLSATALVDTNATAGTVGPLSFNAPTVFVTNGGPAGAGCTATVGSTVSPSDTLNLGGSNLAIGYPCSLSVTLLNGGTFQGLLSTLMFNCKVNTVPTTPILNGAGSFTCGDFHYQDLTSSSLSVVIPAGGSVTYTATYGLPSTVLSTSSGEVVSFLIEIFVTP